MTVRIKVCGITRPQDAVDAAQAGVDAIGLVFYEKSPRYVTVAQAQEIIAALPPFVSVVALFVDPDTELVQQVLAACAIDILQFHGDETGDFCRSFHRPYLKAVRVRSADDLSNAAKWFHDARGLLADAFVEGIHGGTGTTFDWYLLPSDLSLPLILSGGLAPGNVALAVSSVHPAAVDVSSGVEVAKGIKDKVKIAEFISGVRHGSV